MSLQPSVVCLVVEPLNGQQQIMQHDKLHILEVKVVNTKLAILDLDVLIHCRYVVTDTVLTLRDLKCFEHLTHPSRWHSEAFVALGLLAQELRPCQFATL